jgi:hypothetical protein
LATVVLAHVPVSCYVVCCLKKWNVLLWQALADMSSVHSATFFSSEFHNIAWPQISDLTLTFLFICTGTGEVALSNYSQSLKWED